MRRNEERRLGENEKEMIDCTAEERSDVMNDGV